MASRPMTLFEVLLLWPRGDDLKIVARARS
jgi:hypothetical protein